MAELTGKKDFSSSFSLKKIPVSKTDTEIFDTEDNKFADKVKLLELSNYIDNWEKELLFSENGFFSLKGKEVRDKAKEYINELEKFINSKMSDLTFSLENSKQAALELKRLKIENIKSQLVKHEQKELYEWEINVYNASIQAAHDKAILYKYDTEVAIKSIKNGLNIMLIMAEREKWKDKLLKIKKDKFISNCCFDIIKSFIDDKDINFLDYYNTYSKYLIDEQKEKLDSEITDLKDNVIAYNWAVELFSYNLENDENEIKIRKLKNDSLETKVRKYLGIFKKLKKKNEENADKQKVQESWDKINSLLGTEPEKSLLYIQTGKDKDTSKAQNEYIRQIVDKGSTETDKHKFKELFDEMLDDFDKYKERDLNNYRHQLSKEDFEFLCKLQRQKDTEYLKVSSDYKFLFEKLKKAGIKTAEKMYEFILNYRLAVEEYKKINGKDSDIEKRNKIIESVIERNIQK